MSSSESRNWIPAIFLILLLSSDVLAADRSRTDPPRGAHMATQCTDARTCPLFDEVYAATPAFRHALSLALRHGEEQVPDWVKDKLPDTRAPKQDLSATQTASVMLPVRIDERSYLLGRMTDPGNPGHAIAALYDTTRGFVTVHYVNKAGKPALLGDDTEILHKVMNDYLNTDSPFSRSVANPDVTLPVPVTSQ